MATIDINCDMGESFGSYSIGDDESLMEHVSSVNIACGFHGGDPVVMKKTVALAAKYKLAIGAHPGYPDLQGFGRREMNFTPDEIYDLVLYQIGALSAFAVSTGQALHHVKPHGALYNTAAKDFETAKAIAQAAKDFDPRLAFYGLADSQLIRAGQDVGLKTVSEVFADRTYQKDRTLTPRKQHHSLINDVNTAMQQVRDIVLNNQVKPIDGQYISIKADTICIHGDGKNALTFAKAIASTLRDNHVDIRRP